MPTTSRGIYSWLFHGVAVLEDFADRLSHVWTFGLLLIFASIISWKQQMFNNPISCQTPSQFTSSQVLYAHTACWGSNHYFPFDLYGGSSPELSERLKIVGWLYKWLPVVLVIQALLFKFPHIVMYVFHGYSGVSFEKISGLTAGYSSMSLAERNQLGKQIGRYVYNWCKQCQDCLPWRFLTTNWLLVKILYCVNAITQLALVDRLVSTRNPPLDNSTSYGDAIYDNLFNKGSTVWKSPPIFPRKMMCEYQIRQLQDTPRYAVQCDLPINEFNEYAYMIIWVWLLVVALVSCFSLVCWTGLTLLPLPRQRYLSRMLELSEDQNTTGQTMSIAQFTGIIGEDGVSVLKLIASNSSELLVRDAVASMYHMKFSEQHSQYTFLPEAASYPGASASAPAVAAGPGQPPNYDAAAEKQP